MERRMLGKTGIEVTELCLGALPMGPLQKNMPVERCTEVVVKALEEGIGFVDTAQVYRTYQPIKEAMKATGIRPVITTKSHAADYEGMVKAVNQALEQLDVDYVDIFLLHAARADEGVFDQRAGAIQCLKDYKAKGIIKAIGISTHSVTVTSLAADRPDMDIVFPIVNKSGIGIINGTLDDMLAAIRKCSAAGKGVYLMKVLGGGTLINDYCSNVDFARSVEGSQSIAIGMVSPEEVKFNVDYFNNNYDPERMPTIKGYSKRYLIVKTLCIGCKTCISACPNYAIDFDDKTERAVIDQSKCLTCGYCTPVCPEFAIRTI